MLIETRIGRNEKSPVTGAFQGFWQRERDLTYHLGKSLILLFFHNRQDILCSDTLECSARILGLRQLTLQFRWREFSPDPISKKSLPISDLNSVK
jgi:hypothetical protein